MLLRTRSVVTLCVTSALAWACGGKASERDHSIELDAPAEAEDVAAPVEELPSSLEVLELRRSGDGASACTADAYSSRFKVNFRVRLMIWERCVPTPDSTSKGSTNVPLLDADLARVQKVYDELRLSSAKQCAPEPGILTLDLSPEHDTHLLYGDDEHSDCAAPGPQRDHFVAGLDELYALLASIAER